MKIAETNPTSKRPSQRDKILAALRAAGSRGLSTSEMLRCGGFRYSSRLRELRQQNHVITSEPVGNGCFKYVLHHEAPDPAPLPDRAAAVERQLHDKALPLFAGVRP